MHVDRCGTSSVSQPRWVVKADLQHPCKTLNCKVLSRVLSPTSPSRVLHIVATDTAANTALPPPVCVGARRSVRECYTPVDVVRDWRKEERVVRVSTARDVHKRKWSPAEGWISNSMELVSMTFANLSSCCRLYPLSLLVMISTLLARLFAPSPLQAC